MGLTTTRSALLHDYKTNNGSLLPPWDGGRMSLTSFFVMKVNYPNNRAAARARARTLFDTSIRTQGHALRNPHHGCRCASPSLCTCVSAGGPSDSSPPSWTCGAHGLWRAGVLAGGEAAHVRGGCERGAAPARKTDAALAGAAASLARAASSPATWPSA